MKSETFVDFREKISFFIGPHKGREPNSAAALASQPAAGHSLSFYYCYCFMTLGCGLLVGPAAESCSRIWLPRLSRFSSHQFVTWYLRSISKTKIVKLFCLCMSEHMIYIKNVTNMTQTLHQNVTNVTKQNIASKEILTMEFHTKYMKLFVNMLSVICVLLNTKFHNTSENFYFEVILSRTIVSCKVTNVTNPYMDFILDLVHPEGPHLEGRRPETSRASGE